MFGKKELLFSTYLSSRAKNVRFITHAAPPPPPAAILINRPFFFVLENKCVLKKNKKNSLECLKNVYRHRFKI
jgi:hypothetical protein